MSLALIWTPLWDFKKTLRDSVMLEVPLKNLMKLSAWKSRKADINSVLRKCRTNAGADSKANRKRSNTTCIEAGKTADSPNFGEMMANAVTASMISKCKRRLWRQHRKGDRGVDLTQVMISIQKASLSF